jgi:VWFA-related protein
MPHPVQFPTNRRVAALFLVLVLFGSCQRLPAQAPSAQEAPAKNDSAPASVQAPAATNTAEISSRDTPAAFKVRVNLVLVRVVVRDAQGQIVKNLRKDDFQLFDNRKPQLISSFSVETPASRAEVRANSATAVSAAPDSVTPPAVTLPERFVAVVFDDVHMAMEDAATIRDAATRFIIALAPSDRAGIYTTSGQFSQEFTADHNALQQALLGIVPRPVMGGIGHDCPDISYYQADLIENQRDSQALGVATEDAIQCAFSGDRSQASAAQGMAEVAAIRALTAGDTSTEYANRHLEDVLRRLSGMPGQRILVLVSPGFIRSTLSLEASGIIDRATRANIVINTLDVRGLYTPDVMGDIASPPRDSRRTAGYKASYRVAAQSAQSDILAQLADGTGGTFFHNRNDLDEGLRQAGAAPEVSYLLGFSPQNLKLNGSYHTLTVTLTNKGKFSLQARHGYIVPRAVADPAEAAKQEIQEALFSQEEMRDLPIDLKTQFFKMDAVQARLAVLTHVDLKGIRFRKTEGRNRDDLTLVTAIFDENGNFVTGGEKIIEMRLLDTTVERLGRSGLTVKSSFDVKPGAYLVRLVVRDTEGAQMAARNGAVVIPY